MGFNKDIVDILKENLPVYHRKGQGGTFPYVKGEDVTKQLNKAFGHAWSSHVVKHEEVHGQILVLVSVTVNDPVAGVVEHCGFGSARIPKTQSGEILEIGNAYKSAFTNGLKKAAEQFGVGVQPDEEDEPVNSSPPGRSYTPPQPAARPQYSNSAARAPATTPVQQRPAPSAPTPQAAPAQTSSPAQSSGVLTDKPLSDVQKNALKNLAKYRGVAEEALVRGALKGSNKGSFEELTEKEAVDVIRHANSLPKK